MRLFVALELPGEIRQGLGDAVAQLKSKSGLAREGGVRWARPEGMHVTLKFIGHAIGATEKERFDAVRAALATIRSLRPVRMRFRGIGFFPRARRPQVLWCGVEADENLAQLAADIERVLEAIGIPHEGRAFVPHLTLARLHPWQDNSRKRDRSGVARAAAGASSSMDEFIRAATEMATIDFGSSRETEFHLFESILRSTGAEHRKIETYSFWKEAA